MHISCVPRIMQTFWFLQRVSIAMIEEIIVRWKKDLRTKGRTNFMS